MTQVHPARYSRRARILHWLTFALVVAAYVSIYLRKAFERGSDARLLSVESHFMIGIAILLVALPRLLSRFGERAPPITPRLPFWMMALSWITHGLLYAFLIVQPLLGITSRLINGKGIGLPFTDLYIPSLLGNNQALAKSLQTTHEWLGHAFYWVIGLHILAALFSLTNSPR